MAITKMKIRGFERVSNSETVDVSLPTRNDEGSSGYDLYSPMSTAIPQGCSLKIRTGIKAYMKKDEELLLFNRSSMAIKHKVTLDNQVGKIDSSYYNNSDNEGEIIVALTNHGVTDYPIRVGEKICQATFYKYLTADNDIVVNKSRTGGIGSSGK